MPLTPIRAHLSRAHPAQLCPKVTSSLSHSPSPDIPLPLCLHGYPCPLAHTASQPLAQPGSPLKSLGFRGRVSQFQVVPVLCPYLPFGMRSVTGLEKFSKNLPGQREKNLIPGRGSSQYKSPKEENHMKEGKPETWCAWGAGEGAWAWG